MFQNESAPGNVPVPAEIIPRSDIFPRQAETDERLIELWLHGRNTATIDAYSRDLAGFLRFVAKPIRVITIGDVQDWLDQLQGSPATRARRLAAVKSLLTFATTIRYVPFNVGAAVRSPPVTQILADRILSEEDVIRLIALERNPRNHALIRLLYLAGLRVSEACGLRWRDCQPRKPAGQISVVGKRSKVRAVMLPPAIWRELIALKGDAGPDDPVFRSRQGGRLDPVTAWRIVKAAAIRAGLPKAISPHFLRHAHCSHSLDNGAPAHLVQATVGHSDLRTTSRYAHARPNESSASFLRG